jgi:hypothetical protein
MLRHASHETFRVSAPREELTETRSEWADNCGKEIQGYGSFQPDPPPDPYGIESQKVCPYDSPDYDPRGTPADPYATALNRMRDAEARSAGGPGSGWTAEGGHVPGSQGGAKDKEGFYHAGHGKTLVEKAHSSREGVVHGLYATTRGADVAFKQAHDALTSQGYARTATTGTTPHNAAWYSHASNGNTATLSHTMNRISVVVTKKEKN